METGLSGAAKCLQARGQIEDVREAAFDADHLGAALPMMQVQPPLFNANQLQLKTGLSPCCYDGEGTLSNAVSNKIKRIRRGVDPQKEDAGPA